MNRLRRRNPLFVRLVAASLALSMALVAVSAVMRLSNQGLGCAVWPDCYGTIDTAKYARDIMSSDAHPAVPQVPATGVERVHRAVASLLQVLVLAVAFVAVRRRKEPGQPLALPLVLLALSLFLALLGVWYGSPLLRPPVVMANLLGGMAMAAMFWWLYLAGRGGAPAPRREREALGTPAVFGLALIVAQTTLGGWVSSSFAATACGTTFPDCNGSWRPEMSLSKGFAVHATLAVDEQGRAVIDAAAAAAVQVTHRIGALLVALVLGWLGYRMIRWGGYLRPMGLGILALLFAQLLLGVSVVKLGSPLALVVLHNLTAALLWLALVALILRLYRGTDTARL